MSLGSEEPNFILARRGEVESGGDFAHSSYIGRFLAAMQAARKMNRMKGRNLQAQS
jgi:hypothetical protein